MPAGRVGHADHHRPHRGRRPHPAGKNKLAVAARVGRHVDDDRSLAHAVHHGRRDQHRGLAPGHGGRGDHHVGRRHLLGQGLLLLGQFLGGELAGVAAGPLGLHPQVDEGGTEALGLLLGRSAHVVGLDHRPEAAGRGDGLQPGHADPHHQHLGRWHGPGGRHEHRKELRQVLGGRQAGPGPRHRGLRGQRVHALGPADAGQQVEAEDASPGARPGPSGRRRTGRPARSSGGPPLGWASASSGEGGLTRTTSAEPASVAAGIRGDGGAGGARVVGVGEVGGQARLRLHGDLPTPPPPVASPDIGGEGNVGLARTCVLLLGTELFHGVLV